MISAKNIAFNIRGREILSNMSYEFNDGEFVAVIGPNGAGKSSLLHLLSGLNKPSFGEVDLFGKPAQQWKPEELALKRAYLQQQHSVFESFTVEDVLTMGRSASFKYKPSETDKELVTKILNDLQLNHRRHQVFNSLSGGEQQRVQFARTVLQLQENEPEDMKGKVLFLDEPLNNLDLHYQFNLLQMAKEKVVTNGGLVIAVLHDLNITHAFADRVIVLKNGSLLIDSKTETAMEPGLLSTVYNVPIKKVESEGQVFFHVSPGFVSADVLAESKKYIYS